MNKLILSFFAIAFSMTSLLATAVAREKPYGGRCLYINEQEQKQGFKSCQVDIQQKTLAINFKKEQEQDNNKTITGKSVLEIASGEYATKLLSDTSSLITGILLGPISAVGKIFSGDYQQYIIRYKDTEGKETATILNINRSDTPEFQQELTLITGKLITFHPGQTQTTIDIGPDFKNYIKEGGIEKLK